MHLAFDHREYAVIGFTGVLASLPRFAALERRLRSLIRDADLFVAIDYPGLNLRLCAEAKRRGVPVLYYIAPQVWAWGEGRVARIRVHVDRLAAVLPFEEAFFRDRGVNVEYVGHPFLVDHELPEPNAENTRAGLALLPGSRIGEVRAILPVMLAAATRLRARHPALELVVAKSPVVVRAEYDRLLERAPGGVALADDAVSVLNGARAALVASGTATLQSALLGTPLAVVYRTSALNYAIARRVVRIENVGLVNVLLGEAVAPEFVQGRATPEALANAADTLLFDDGARATALARFASLRDSLGRGRGCERVAEMAAELLA